MSKCACIEPAPTRFYAPAGLFSGADLKRMGAVWLGETIVSPGCDFSYQVASSPLCRLYWGNGKPEPHNFESAYYQDEKRRWQRSHCNYLSYLLTNGEYLTVRWQSPMGCASAFGRKLQKAA
jgi:hypothetical protein